MGMAIILLHLLDVVGLLPDNQNPILAQGSAPVLLSGWEGMD
jgi:hypothetical protein